MLSAVSRSTLKSPSVFSPMPDHTRSGWEGLPELWAAPIWVEGTGTCAVRVPANLHGPWPSLDLRGKILCFQAVLPGRVQDGSQGMQLHVRAGDL